MDKNGNLIGSLTSLRIFAALAVFVSHLDVFTQSSLPLFSVASKYFANGYAGVTFFYILSGFIINYSYVRHAAEKTFSSKDFIVFRFARLFPVHLAALLCFILLLGGIKGFNSNAALPYNIFLLQSFVPDPGYFFSFNPVSWSISCEMFFYLSFCLLVKCKTSYLAALFLMLQALNIYFINYPVDISQQWLFYINPFFRITDFILGVIICRFYLKSSGKPLPVICSVMEVLSLSFLCLTVYYATNYARLMSVKYDLLYIPCMASIVIAFAYNGGVISRLLSHKYILLLGEASFSFYMFHWIVVMKLALIMQPNANDIKLVMLYITACLLLSIIGAILSFKFFETPANKMLRSMWLNAKALKMSKVANP